MRSLGVALVVRSEVGGLVVAVVVDCGDLCNPGADELQTFRITVCSVLHARPGLAVGLPSGAAPLCAAAQIAPFGAAKSHLRGVANW